MILKKKIKLGMKNRILLVFALFFNAVLFAQEFYLLNDENQIYSYNYNSGVATFLTNVNLPDDRLLDIAYADEDHLYATTEAGLIIDIDIITGDFDAVFNFQNDHIYNGLVYNTDHNLVTIDSQAGTIVTFSLDTNTVISEFIIGTGNPGDLTYYQGNLVFQGMNSSNILAFDGSIVKSIACALFVGYWGLSNFTIDCNTNLLLAFDGNGKVWEYDIEGETYEEYDNLNAQLGGIYGSTTVNEQFAYDCTLFDLPAVDCTLNVPSEEISTLVLYPNPVTTKLWIQPNHNFEVLQYEIYSVQGQKILEGSYQDGIDFSEVVAGVYFVKLWEANNSAFIFRSVIKK